MKLLIAGSQRYDDYMYVKQRVEHLTKKTAAETITILHTEEDYGIAKIAADYAKNKELKAKVFTADWEKKGKQAAILRNQKMVGAATHAAIFDDGSDPHLSVLIGMLKEYCVKYLVFKIKKVKDKQDGSQSGQTKNQGHPQQST